MPRKVGYSPNYDDEYDDYDDDYSGYDEEYNYDNGAELDRGHTPLTGKSVVSQTNVKAVSLWKCSICTYDNDESMFVCEMCGVFKESFVNSARDGAGKDVKLKPAMERSLPTKTMSKKPVGNKGFGQDISLQPETSMRLKGKNTTELSYGNETYDHSGPASYSFQPKEESTPGASSSEKHEDHSDLITAEISQLKLEKEASHSAKLVPLEQYKPEKWILDTHEQGSSSQLNLAIVGHVDSGKSTLSGRLLHLLGRISSKDMHKHEKEAREKGKGSFAFAWALDESVEERERGITMTVGVAYFESKKFRVVLLDSPGHQDFVPNLISGATQADAAILVVDASPGSFEAGINSHDVGIGQTREHAQLIKSFGVEQLIVAVNKMDAVEYSKERYDYIKEQLGNFLRSCKYKDSYITWVPISAMENQNLTTASSDARLTSWYNGLCLLDAIDSLQAPIRDVLKPLILPICDIVKLPKNNLAGACGKIEAGAIKSGLKVLIMPGEIIATVRSIERDTSDCSIARAGDNVMITLQGADESDLIPGGVICHPDFPVPVATRLELKILVLEIVTPILIGHKGEFHIHHAKESGRVAKFVSLLDPKTGKASKSAPRFLKSKQSAVIEVVLDGAVCVQEYAMCRALGRVSLRSLGMTIAIGVVTRVLS